MRLGPPYAALQSAPVQGVRNRNLVPRLNAYSAGRYVIAARVGNRKCKLFQIAFSKKDGSLFVTFPYLKGCIGRVGEITLPAGQNYFENFRITDEFPVTSHLVKYSHHPSGQAHFSLTGKVRTSILTESVPLSEVNGHLFTVRFQGFEHFAALEAKKRATKARGIVEFPFDGAETPSIKIVCHWYSEREVARVVQHKNDSPWGIMLLPEGRKAITIPLLTPYSHEGERRYLLLGAERDEKPFSNEEKGIAFVGGFDPESVVFDYSVASKYLMMFLVESENFAELIEKFGTIDL